jgi:CRP-like cAMP-binding protein
MDNTDIPLAQLRHIKSLARLSDDELATFHQYVEMLAVPRQTVLFEEGQPGDCLYLILEGRTRAFTRKQDGGTDTVKMLDAGETFGDIAVFHHTTRKASVEAVQDSQLLKLTAASLDSLQSEQPVLSTKFLRSLTLSLGRMYSS